MKTLFPIFVARVCVWLAMGGAPAPTPAHPATAVPPTVTSVPTATATSIPPTATPTATWTPTQTPLPMSTNTPAPPTATRVPPTPTHPPLPSCADTPVEMAGLLWINQFDGEATITIVDHEYRVPGNSTLLIPIPAGKKFVIDAFIPGVGRLRPAPGPFTWDAGYCELWSPGRAP